MSVRTDLINEINSIAKAYYGVELSDQEYFSEGDLVFFLRVLSNSVFIKMALADRLDHDPAKVSEALKKVEEEFKADPDSLKGWLTGDTNAYKQEDTEAYKAGYEDGYQKAIAESCREENRKESNGEG